MKSAILLFLFLIKCEGEKSPLLGKPAVKPTGSMAELLLHEPLEETL